MTLTTLVVWLVIGGVAGWLAGVIVRGGGSDVITNIIVGIAGAFLGGWLLNALGIFVLGGILGSIVSATVGAIVLLLILRVVRRA